MEELFIHISDILEDEDTYNNTNYELLKKLHLKDKEIRDKLIQNNIKLVIHQVVNKFQNVNYDKKDLVSIGIIGLIKAVDTFDITRKVEFSTYAVRCINNEILLFLRTFKRYQYEKSLNLTLFENDKLELIDTLFYETTIEEKYNDKEQLITLRKIINNLPDRDRELIKMYFGFENKRYTQKEISEKFNISQAQVSKILLTTLDHIKTSLEILDVNGESRYKKLIKKCNIKRLTD